MGGTTGTGTGTGTGALGAQTAATDPNRFAGSRAAADAGTAQTPDWSTLTGLLGTDSPAAPAATPASASPLAVNPTATGTQYGTPAPGAAGFTSTPYGDVTPGNLPHIGAPDKPKTPTVDPAKPFAAPTSFRPIWDVTSEVSQELSRKYAGVPHAQQLGWDKDPVRALEWLQLVADKGGDWRDSTTGAKGSAYPYGYNIAAPAGMGQVYWPGDPARPK